MHCEEVRPLLSAGLDGELEPPITASVQAHIAGCALCAAEREALSATVRLLRAVPEADPPAELRRRIGVTLLEIERRSERRWLGLAGLARPQAAGWAWGIAVGTVAATVGLLTSRAPSTPRPIASAPSAPRATVLAPRTAAALSGNTETGRPLSPTVAKKPAPRMVTARVAPLVIDPKPMLAPDEAPHTASVSVPPAAALRAASKPSTTPRRLVPAVRRSPSAPPRSAPSPSARSAPGSGRPDATTRDTPLVASSETAPPSFTPDSGPMGDEHRAGTAGMTQMASGVTEAPAPTDAHDDLVELRRRLLDRPLNVPELGALKPVSSPQPGRDGWIRF
jgi:hypothetical protein